MNQKITAPHGSWRSPITTDLLLARSIGLGQLAVDGDAVYWTESRPQEGGRSVLVRWTAADGRLDVTPAPLNVRTRAHEYGGGAYSVRPGEIIFANFADQRLYRQAPGADPQPVTPEAAVRFADGVWVPGDGTDNGRFICVREDHRGAGEAVNSIVSLALDGEDLGATLVSGNDFYSTPRVSPDGTRLAWLTWNHPNMPWDGTELWAAELTPDGGLTNAQRVAGGAAESIFQPEWSPDGVLHFVSDRSGWWNLYRWRDGAAQPLYPDAAEYGLPQWAFAMRAYAFITPTTLLCTRIAAGVMTLARLDTSNGRFTPLDLPFTFFHDVHVAADQALFIGGSPTQPAAVVRLDLATGAFEILRQASDVTVDPGYLSTPQPLAFPTSNGRSAHAFYYPPQNRDFCAPADEKPPLLVLSHGGPTSMTTATFNLGKQYWTSRGFGVLDVNYGGSTGYGRAYRERLNGQWGVVDVEDCVHGARYLVEQGLADGARLAIRGGSAGGYTTLCALTFHDLFSAGASHFGVSDAEALAQETHKFESRYLDNLIGPYPEQRELYVARSPIHHTDRLNCPLILFQGLEDAVVPPNQAERMYTAVKAKGLPVAYLAFAGEQHGFRRAENIKRALEAELYFYGKLFGFTPADAIEPVPIANWPP
jgi:dipeptidyl aminopeptidase/acylaminoacyl peptidase